MAGSDVWPSSTKRRMSLGWGTDKPLEDAKPTKDVKSIKVMKLAASLKLTKED